MRYLIDTNVCIYIMNQQPVDLIGKFKKKKIGEIGISTITVSELRYGVAKSKFKRQNEKRLDEFLVPFDILPYDENASKSYGAVRSQLETQGNIIGPLDMFIAAHALSRDLVLVTNNEKEFRRIQGLEVENWI